MSLGFPSHMKVIFHYEKPPSLLQTVVFFVMASCTLWVVVSVPEEPVTITFSVDVCRAGVQVS